MPQVVVSSKGQVVLPRAIRERLGIDRGTVLEVEVCDDKVTLAPTKPGKRGWKAWKGVLKGKTALQDHLREHRDEIAHPHPLLP